MLRAALTPRFLSFSVGSACIEESNCVGDSTCDGDENICTLPGNKKITKFFLRNGKTIDYFLPFSLQLKQIVQGKSDSVLQAPSVKTMYANKKVKTTRKF